MTIDGGGWTVFQRRVDNSVDFNRKWKDYKEGFGDLTGNFWLGLDKLHKLAAPGKRAMLRIDMKYLESGNQIYSIKYSVFVVESEANGYRLIVTGASGNGRDSLGSNNRQMFSTYDNDQDSHHATNCAGLYTGGWWYSNCGNSNLNGIYPSTSSKSAYYISWNGMSYGNGRITFSEMKLKTP